MSGCRRNHRILCGISAACSIVLVLTGLVLYRHLDEQFPTSLPTGPYLPDSSSKTHGSSSAPSTNSTGTTQEPAKSMSSDLPLQHGVEQTYFSRYSLSTTQCNSEFADLFKETDSSVAHRKKIGNVTPSDIDLGWKPDGAVKAMIYNQKVFNLAQRLKIRQLTMSTR